jgi:hypothetical protein
MFPTILSQSTAGIGWGAGTGGSALGKLIVLPLLITVALVVLGLLTWVVFAVVAEVNECRAKNRPRDEG